MITKLWNSIRTNHIAHMAICCALPVLLILALQFFGIGGVWLYPLALVVCIGSHLLMTYTGLRNKNGEKSCH